MLGFDLALLKTNPESKNRPFCRMLEALSSSCEGGESRVIRVHRARCVVVLERCSYSKFDIASS